MLQRIRLLALCCAAMAWADAAGGSAAQAVRLPANFGPLPGNPADRLSSPIDAETYDPATHCSGPQHRKGMLALEHWLAANGKLRKHLDPTAAHRNHVHIGMTKQGAAGRTSFWIRP